MHQKVKVAIVFGTRPEAIKLFPLVHALRERPGFEVVVISSGQHRGMLDQVLKTVNIVPDYDINVMTANQSLDKLTSRLIVEIGTILDRENPQWVVVQGDTTTAMSGALAAYYRKIRVCHVEAGLRSWDPYSPWPEEINRRIIATIASLHCAPTENASLALQKENVDPNSVHVTGNTVIDALNWVIKNTDGVADLSSELESTRQRFFGRRIIGVTAHRRENLGKGMLSIAKALKKLADREDIGIVFPVHLNPNVREIVGRELADKDNIALLDPLDYFNFTKLMEMSHIMLTDSGGVQEEAPALGKPVLVMRETTERPEGVAAGTAILVGTEAETIVSATEHLLDDENAYRSMARAHNPFGDGAAAQRIADLLR